MTFSNSIKSVFSKYFQFSDRAMRSEYWWFMLFSVLMSVGTGLASLAVPFIDTLWSLAILIPSLAVSWRRFHDIDRSGWWSVLPLAGAIPLLAGIMTDSEILLMVGGLAIFGLYILVIVWLASKGTDGPNRFGDDPLGRMDAGVFE